METEESVMQCMEHVRESGMCNMFDGRCVAEVAEAICEDDAWAAMKAIVAERRGYGKILSAFMNVEGAAGRLTTPPSSSTGGASSPPLSCASRSRHAAHQ